MYCRVSTRSQEIYRLLLLPNQLLDLQKLMSDIETKICINQSFGNNLSFEIQRVTFGIITGVQLPHRMPFLHGPLQLSISLACGPSELAAQT